MALINSLLMLDNCMPISAYTSMFTTSATVDSPNNAFLCTGLINEGLLEKAFFFLGTADFSFDTEPLVRNELFARAAAVKQKRATTGPPTRAFKSNDAGASGKLQVGIVLTL